MAGRRRTERTTKRQAAFLEALAAGDTVSAALKSSAWGRTEAYKHRRTDPKFAKAWAAAEDEGTDLLIREARRRAVEGVEKTIFYKGTPIGREINYSDTLLIFLLKSRRPYEYDDGMRRAKVEREWRKEDGVDTTAVVNADTIVAALAAFEASKAALADHGAGK